MGISDKIKDILRSIWLYIIVVITLPTLFPVAMIIWVVTFPFDRRLVVLHAFTSFWSSIYTWGAPFWKVKIENRDKIDKKKVYVLVANHQSLLDIPVLFRLFRHYKWVSKIENFRVPIIGWVMSLNRYIRLIRGRRASILQMMEDGKKTLRNGSSLMIFPEGTRSETTQMGKFKEGAFLLAKETGVPVLPIILDGTGKALPKHEAIFRGKHILRIKVMDEIPPEIFKDMPARELALYVQNLMEKELYTMTQKT